MFRKYPQAYICISKWSINKFKEFIIYVNKYATEKGENNISPLKKSCIDFLPKRTHSKEENGNDFIIRKEMTTAAHTGSKSLSVVILYWGSTPSW